MNVEGHFSYSFYMPDHVQVVHITQPLQLTCGESHVDKVLQVQRGEEASHYHTADE